MSTEKLKALKETFSNNAFLREILLDLSKVDKKVNALANLRREYPLIYAEYMNLVSDDPVKSEELVKQLIS